MIQEDSARLNNTILKRSILLLTLSLCTFLGSSLYLYAQEEDAQLRLAASLESDFSKSLSWSTEIQQRFYDNIRRFDAFLIEPAVSYTFASHFKLTGAYRMVLFDDLETGAEFKQRVNIDLRAKKDIDYWSFKFRTRLQYGFEESLIFEDGGNKRLVNRNLLEVGYFIYGTRFTPYLNSEFYYYMNAEEGGYISKYRIQVGTDIYINKKSELTAYFIYEPELNRNNPLTSYIYGLKYAFKL